MHDFDTIEELDASFESAWETNQGCEQSRYFMELLLKNLPEFAEPVLAQANDILDVGCALGDGTAVLAKAYPHADVMGIDPSPVAIGKAAQKFYVDRYRFHFMRASLEEMVEAGDQFELVVCSNVLEHFSKPQHMFKQLLKITEKFLVVLVPYNEVNRIPGHRATITEKTFPAHCIFWHRGGFHNFQRVFSKVIDTRESGFWYGDQLLQLFVRSCF